MTDDIKEMPKLTDNDSSVPSGDVKYPTPGHQHAAENPEPPVDHLEAIAELAAELPRASQSRAEAIAGMISGHVAALRGDEPVEEHVA